MRVSAGQVVEYAAMPGILPRLKDLLFSGFGPVTRLIGIICYMAGLIPASHPCFKKETRDNYGLRHILGIAASNVKFEWKHADQVIVFAMIVCGTVMLFLFLAGLVIVAMTGTANALGATITDIFVTRNPERDIAFMMLDRVFGIPELYNSCVARGAPCFQGDVGSGPFPNNLHRGLHELFRFYSMGIFFIALPIFLYYVVHYVYGVTQTGKWLDGLSDDVMAPYDSSPSKGFSWLPIRYVVCFGLLIPYGQWGLNSAQWITLYTAKFASGMATNAWLQYNQITGDNPLGETNIHLVAEPNSLDTASLMKGLFLMRACHTINAWGVTMEANLAASAGAFNTRLYVVKGNQSRPIFGNALGGANSFIGDGASYSDTASTVANGSGVFPSILQFTGYGDIHLVYGDKDDANPTKYKEYPGGVLPTCGEITVPVTGKTGEAIFAAEGYFFAVMNILADVNRPGIGMTNEERAMFAATMREYVRTSSLVKEWSNVVYGGAPPQAVLDAYLCGPADILGPCTEPVRTQYWIDMMNEFYKYAFSVPPFSAYDFLAGTATAEAYDDIYALTGTAWNAVGARNPFLITPGILEYGWGGAGLWYNKISERNGSLYTAVTSLPQIKRFPQVMERIKEERRKTDSKVSSVFCENYDPRKSGTSSSYQFNEKSQFKAEEAVALNELCHQLYHNESLVLPGTTRTASPTNAVESAIATIFSEFKVFDIYKNHEVTPMAQLSSIGRVLVDKALLAFIGSAATAAFGGMQHAAAAGGIDGADMFANASQMVSTAMSTFAVIGLVGGLVLHYMLPFMPFIYFFFAVGRWVKVIFEAMVGVPLWALAHMRNPGPGLPGDAASGGYFLLLDIFVRPIVTVLSLIAAFAIFSAMAVGLNSVFNLVATNLFGVYSMEGLAAGSFTAENIVQLSRGMVDQFFLSMLYIIIVYMCGTAAFKLIDLIPDGIIRWAGHGVQGIGSADNADDLIDHWQFELPMRAQGVASDVGKMVQQALYDPFKEMNDKAKKEKAEKEAKEKAEKEAKEKAEKDKADKDKADKDKAEQDQNTQRRMQEEQAANQQRAAEQQRQDMLERQQRDALEQRNRQMARDAERRMEEASKNPAGQLGQDRKPVTFDANGKPVGPDGKPLLPGQTPQGGTPTTPPGGGKK